MAQLKNLIVEGDSRLIGDTNVGKITASSIVKSGGTSSQFLKADGSVDSSTYATTAHTHTTTLAADSGTSSVTLSAGGKYKLTAGGNSVIFTMPAGTSSDVYWATYGTSTYAEVRAALEAGKEVLMKYAVPPDGDEIRLFRAGLDTGQQDGIYFSCTDGYTMIETSVDTSDSWDSMNSYIVESISNRVSTLTGNTSATNKYPNCKAVADYVGRNAAGKYSCTKSSGSGVTSLFCCNGNLVCYGSSSSFTGTFAMTVSNFYEAFMKSIGGYTLDKEALSDTNKITELAYLMTNSSITKLAAGSGSNSRYEFSYQSINGSTGTPTSFTYGASSSGCRISVSTSGVTLTIV